MVFIDYVYNFIDKVKPIDIFTPDIDINIYRLDDVITKNIINNNKIKYFVYRNVYSLQNKLILLNNNFISNEIKESVKLDFNNCYIISFNYKNVVIKLNLVYDKIPPDSYLINSLVARISFLLKLTSLNHEIKEILNITIFLTKFQKKFSNENSIIGINNVNSGCTIKMDNFLGEIIIWRIEECEKVLIHELIHALGLDFHEQTPSVLNKIYNTYDISSKKYINLFEVYTETWAVIFNTYNNSYNLGNKQFLKDYYWWESYYSIVQSVKILKYFGYSKFDECQFYCSTTFKIKTLKFKQGTSVLSYYIFKSLLLYNIDKFIEYCFKQNPIKPWVFKSSDVKFYLFLENLLDKSNFINLINSLLTKDYEFDTLRMTLFEIQK